MTASTLSRGEPGYPADLARIARAPARLRVRGSLGDARRRRVAVVGTRKPDGYGLEVAARLARDLARAGVSVVSGGAEGIDAAAHRSALDARGHTVAVFGCGLDVTSPAGHGPLFERIVACGGALVSEYEDDTHPTRYTFPERNRIISGLSEAVVVVRAAAQSGALLTADWARQQGVPVFAVPGAVDDRLSQGPLALLRAGARVAANAADVLDALGLQLPLELPVDPPVGLDPAGSALYGALAAVPRHADDLARATGLGPATALAGLLSLELEGLCEQRPGHYFLRR